MPQQELPDMGRFKASVLIFKQFAEEIRPKAAAAGLEDYVNAKFHIKDWTKEDVYHFAISPNGLDGFNTLDGIVDAALTKDGNGKLIPGTTPDAICAQNALTYLKPDCCKNWKSFANMIMEVHNETITDRANIEAKYPDKARRKFIPDAKPEGKDQAPGDKSHGSIIELHAPDVCLSTQGVKLDAEHDLKSPGYKAKALEAVKGIVIAA